MPSQQRNLVLFFVVSFVIFMGGTALQNYLWPPPKRTRPTPAVVTPLPYDQLWGGVPAAQGLVAQAPVAPGVAGALPVVGQLAAAEWAAGDRAQWVRVAPEPKPKPTAPEPPKVAAAPVQKITLGDDTVFNLQVTLTSRGGAVQEIILNKFEEATREGLPTKPPQRLHIVPDD